ncbi:MbtH family protein [Kitasatospora sp. NPDC096147]|uniref:MbtH family protein n=1 Tax=Kitasatospora sp. NPDC096147 TaxID=3364093 RepID=UPI0037F4430B
MSHWRFTVFTGVSDEFEVVVNGEEQYSIWRAGREVPAGWTTVGKRGPREECLRYIDDSWTDMRPLSLRNA